MADIRCRPVEDRDREALNRVLGITFNDGVAIPVDDNRLGIYRSFVAEADGQIVGGYSVVDFTCTRGPAVLRNGGVAGVAVLPEWRRSGVGGEMMRYAVRQMREDGLPLASLYAFRESYYRRFGYEVAGHRIQINCPTHRLPKVASDLPVRRLGPDDWQVIEPCFEAWAKARSGLSLRTPALWRRFLNEHRPNTLYVMGDPVEGYVAVCHQTAFWADQPITEIAWSTEEGYRACLAYLSQLGINKTSITWYEPSDSPFYGRFMDQGIQIQVSRPAMFRVNDVPRALARMVTEERDDFVLEVLDEVVPENAGPWRVAFRPDGVTVEPGGEPDFRIDVRHLAQGLLGSPSLADLARVGLVQVLQPAGFRAAERLLPPMPVYLPEFF